MSTIKDENLGVAPELRRPGEILNDEDMTLRQWLIIAICVGALALDGYDVLSISLAGAGISDEWGLTKAELGFLLPLELLGMAIGSAFIGALSDFRGRRPVLLLCLSVMTLGMAISGYANSFTVLAISRVFTGLGIGGALAAATAMSSEFCSAKHRSFAVVLVAGGFSLGIWVASKIAGFILLDLGWRYVFLTGAAISFAFIPLVYFLVPESVSFLERSGQPRAREKIERIINKLGHDVKFKLQTENTTSEAISPSMLFGKEYQKTTTILSLAYLLNILTYYYFVKWIPPVVVDIGFSQADSSRILGVVSVGGLMGSIATAILSRIIRLKKLIIWAMFFSAAMVALFPYMSSSIENMMIFGFLAGFFLFAVIGGAFGLFAEAFPSSVLGVGSGFVLGVGRGGAVLGPWIAGLLFSAGFGFTIVSPMMAMGSFLAGLLLIFLPIKRLNGRTVS